MDHILPCTPQGGSMSRLYPTCYNTKVYIGGVQSIINYGVSLETHLQNHAPISPHQWEYI